MKDITLLVMAAGMGSRYGGLKQLDAVGPNGETIIDFSVYDAIRVGYNKVVFIIREDFEKQFKQKISNKYKDKIDVEIVYQDLNDLPSSFCCPNERHDTVISKYFFKFKISTYCIKFLCGSNSIKAILSSRVK